jgi:hypothetical protein
MKKIVTIALIIFSFQSFAQDCIPLKNAVVHLDGTIYKSGGQWYMKDKLGTKDFLINGTMDFDSTNVEAGLKQFPHRLVMRH